MVVSINAWRYLDSYLTNTIYPDGNRTYFRGYVICQELDVADIQVVTTW